MSDHAPVIRGRRCRVDLGTPGVDRERLAEYLSEVDRPVASLLARERLSREGPGEFTYRSNPHRLWHLEIVPTLGLSAKWRNDRLELRSTCCRIAGLGDWDGSVGFTLQAELAAAEGALEGWAEVGLVSRLAAMVVARRLAGVVLEGVLDRIERRLHRGLRKDALAWLRSKQLDPPWKGGRF
jgi:hypothetical protein